MTKVNVAITPDNRILVAVPDGDFAAARAAIERLLAELGAEGLPLVSDGPVERHRQDDEEAHAGGHVDLDA